MVLEIIRAGLLGALPVALFTFAMLQWSIASGRMNTFTGEKALQRQHVEQARAAKKAKKFQRGAENMPVFHHRAAGDFVHSKAMLFGGGFYGTMAVLTYVLIEIIEIGQFIAGLADPDTWLNKLGLDLLINFFVNSLLNLVQAFVWFGTLPDYITINNGFVWLAAAYLGYLGGLRLVNKMGDHIWEVLAVRIGALIASFKSRRGR